MTASQTPGSNDRPKIKPGERMCVRWNYGRRVWVPKTAFASRYDADAAVVTFPKDGLHAYACEKHGWHVGHKPR